jgi:hypothetical protein
VSCASDLIEQSTTLCAADPRRPKQVSLRRARSSAYYAVYHELSESVVAFVLPGRRWDLQVLLRRKLAHRTMKNVAQRASSSATRALAAVGSAFVSLQEARHRADHDFSRSFTRFETATWIRRAADAVDKWTIARTTADGERFALELLVGTLDA